MLTWLDVCAFLKPDLSSYLIDAATFTLFGDPSAYDFIFISEGLLITAAFALGLSGGEVLFFFLVKLTGGDIESCTGFILFSEVPALVGTGFLTPFCRMGLLDLSTGVLVSRRLEDAYISSLLF